jgi:hypothetical protein
VQLIYSDFLDVLPGWALFCWTYSVFGAFGVQRRDHNISFSAIGLLRDLLDYALRRQEQDAAFLLPAASSPTHTHTHTPSWSSSPSLEPTDSDIFPAVSAAAASGALDARAFWSAVAENPAQQFLLTTAAVLKVLPFLFLLHFEIVSLLS